METPEDWDKGIPLILFTTHAAPNESTGYSFFELVYGHEVRGPRKFVKDRLLLKEELGTPNLLDYISDFCERLFRMCEMARKHLKESQSGMKAQADRKEETHNFKPGNKVLALLPMVQNPLAARFQGPYKVERKLNAVNYVVSTPDRRKSRHLWHVNMLQRYHECEIAGAIGVVKPVPDPPLDVDDSVSFKTEKGDVPPIKLTNSELLSNIGAELQHLSQDQQKDVRDLLFEFKPMCTDTPGLTTWAFHDVDVGYSKHIKHHHYRVNPAKAAIIKQEV